MAALSLLFAISGCKTKPVPPVAVLARVGEKILSDEEVKAWESYLPKDKLTPETRNDFIRNWVEKEILISVALEKGLDDDPWVEARLDDLHRELLTSRLLELESTSHTLPGTREVLDYYTRHAKEFFWKHPHLSITYWRSNSRPPLDRLRATLTQNRPTPLFPSEVAQIDSGKFEIDDPERFDSGVWKIIGWMNSGQISHPVVLRNTYWMFRIDRKDEQGTQMPLDAVVDEITARLNETARLNYRNELIRSYAEKYRNEGRLQWIDSSLSTTSAPIDEKINE